MKSRLMNLLAARPVLGPVPYATLGDGEHGWMYRVRQMAWNRVSKPYELTWLKGVRLHVASNDETLWAIFSTGCVEPNEFRFLDDLLKPGMTFIDVGANLGLYSLFASRKVGPQGKVLAIEASRREFTKLERNIELNAASNIRPLHLAIADRRSTTEMRIATEYNAGHNSLGGFAYEHTQLERMEVVETFTLDEIVARQTLESVDVIKMDVEGSELFALRGARETIQRFHPVMLVEMSDRSFARQGYTSTQVWDLLVGCGYRLTTFDSLSGNSVPAERAEHVDSINVVATHNPKNGEPIPIHLEAANCNACGSVLHAETHDCAADKEKWRWVKGKGWQPKHLH